MEDRLETTITVETKNQTGKTTLKSVTTVSDQSGRSASVLHACLMRGAAQASELDAASYNGNIPVTPLSN